MFAVAVAHFIYLYVVHVYKWCFMCVNIEYIMRRIGIAVRFNWNIYSRRAYVYSMFGLDIIVDLWAAFWHIFWIKPPLVIFVWFALTSQYSVNDVWMEHGVYLFGIYSNRKRLLNSLKWIFILYSIYQWASRECQVIDYVLDERWIGRPRHTHTHWFVNGNTWLVINKAYTYWSISWHCLSQTVHLQSIPSSSSVSWSLPVELLCRFLLLSISLVMLNSSSAVPLCCEPVNKSNLEMNIRKK